MNMMATLPALALGVVIFAIMIGVGVVLLNKFGNAIAQCPSAESQAFNSTDGYCWNATAAKAVPGNPGFTDSTNFITELGTTSGLGSWTGAVVALIVGLLFIGALSGKREY